MARPSFRQNSLPVAGLSLAAVGLVAAAYGLGGSDAVVEHGFARALASLAGPATQATQSLGADLLTTSGEQLRISRVAHDGARDAGKPFAKPVAIGDRITIASGGHERKLHVVKVDQLDSSIVPASSANPAPLLLVTCSDDSNPKARPVRFLIEADETLPTLSVTTAARTL